MNLISIIKVKIVSVSPLYISDGEDLLLDKNGLAYMPATSIAGAFRAYLDSLEEDPSYLFGKGGDESVQSSIYIKDSYAKTNGIERRDGVSIDRGTGASLKTSKIDRVYLKKGLCFSLEFKIEDKNGEIETKKEKLYKCLRGLHNSFIRFGGNKSNGLGIFEVKEIKTTDFNFNNIEEWTSYIKKDLSKALDITDETLSVIDNNSFIKFDLNGYLKTPLLIGASESYDHEEVDKSSMKSGEEYIVPGSSFKGLIRSRIEKIANFYNNSQISKEIFGDLDKLSQEKRNTLSRVFVNEAVIDTKDFENKKYNRIRIDMFTGGVRKSALADDEPVQGNINFKLIYRLKGDKAKDNYAIGIIILALKDLATENLSLGSGYSIGRGIYIGETLKISLENEIIEIDFNEKTISNENKINKYIKSVRTFKEEAENERVI